MAPAGDTITHLLAAAAPATITMLALAAHAVTVDDYHDYRCCHVTASSCHRWQQRREITEMLHKLLLVASTMVYCTEAKYVEGNLRTDKVGTLYLHNWARPCSVH